jgi:hypothetical protein
MGLAERRAAKNFTDNLFPGFKKQIDEAAHFDVPIDVKWDTLQADGMADGYAENWAKVYFQPLVTALKAITIDDLGKEALKGGLKKIVIENKSGVYYGDRWATLQDGVLTLDHEPCTNVDNVDERATGLQQVLEKGL